MKLIHVQISIPVFSVILAASWISRCPAWKIFPNLIQLGTLVSMVQLLPIPLQATCPGPRGSIASARARFRCDRRCTCRAF
ncbi:hypothetical protein BGX38DRAFT_1160461, partial [Terfezia claveryi]